MSHSFESIQNEIAAMLEVPDEELTEDQRMMMDAYLDELASAEAIKVDGFAQFLRLEGERADALRKESQRLASRARTAEGRIAYLKTKYLDTMQRHGLRKVNGNVYALSVREGKVVVIADASMLPEHLLRVKMTSEPDKIAIKQALLAGKDVPGCELRDSYSLQVR